MFRSKECSFVVSFLLLCSLTKHTVHAWFPPSFPLLSSSRYKATRLFESKSEESSNEASIPDIAGKNIFGRVFYRLSDYSEVDICNNLLVEERVRFKPDEAKGEGCLKPAGRRTLILRDGKVEEGDIGDELFVIDVRESMAEDATHSGAGRDREMESTIAMILFLAANPKYIEGTVLEVGCKTGLAGLLGAIGAGALKANNKKEKTAEADTSDDILTIPKGTPLTNELKSITLSDEEPEYLNLALANARLSNVPSSQLNVEELSWRKRSLSRAVPKIYHTIIAADLGYNYLEAKELAHTVAHRLEAYSTWEALRGESKSPPAFLHVCPDAREDASYLHKFLTKGYRMNVRTGYVKLEKLIFNYQMLPESEPEEKLDDLELEVQEFKETIYQSMIAEHDPLYADGAGEIFFPMETGEYDAASSRTFLEPESDGSKWY